MTFFDLLIFSVLALSALLGFIRGFSRELVTLIAIGLGAWISYLLGGSVAGLFGEGIVAVFLAFGVLFLLVFIAASLLLEWVASRFLGVKPRLPDKIAGAVFGTVRGWLLVGLFYLAFTYYASEDALPPTIEKAWLKGIATSAASVLERMGLEKEAVEAESLDLERSE